MIIYIAYDSQDSSIFEVGDETVCNDWLKIDNRYDSDRFVMKPLDSWYQEEIKAAAQNIAATDEEEREEEFAFWVKHIREKFKGLPVRVRMVQDALTKAVAEYA